MSGHSRFSTTDTKPKATDANTARRGTPPAETFSSPAGASPRSASENTMREDPYRLALSADSSATNTTMFMIWPAAGMPMASRTATYGLSPGFSESHGSSVTMTSMEPT